MIYQRFEKENLKKNYIEIVEIFETIQRPPNFIENEKELNDFLGKDAFKADMNCSTVTTEKSSVTTSTKPLKDPTSTHRQPSPTTPYPTTTIRPPNLDHLFTIKPTKSTIRPNPKENENPDYTELYNWQKNRPKPNVQVTKHLPTTIKPPLIVIKETDVQVTKNRTQPNNSGGKNVETTTVIDPNNENYDEQGDGSENGSDNGDEDYDENSYSLVNENDEHNQLGDDDDNYETEEEDETKKRRKRLNKNQRRRKHIQSKQNLISKNS